MPAQPTVYSYTRGTGNRRAERTVLTPDGGSIIAHDGPTAQRLCDELNFLLWCKFACTGVAPTKVGMEELRSYYDSPERHDGDYDPAPDQYLDPHIPF